VSKCRKQCGEIYFETEDGALTVFKDFKKRQKRGRKLNKKNKKNSAAHLWEIYLKLGMKVV
jgi:hypothetical protein